MSSPFFLKRSRCAEIPCISSSKHLQRPWASLPEELVELIGWRVLAGDLLGYVRLRAVCAHWNHSTVRPRGRGLLDARFHPCRWMMLPEGDGLYPGHPHLVGYVRFLSLSTGVLVRVHLPLFHDHIVLDSVDGLLLLLLLHRDHGTGIRLLHPFTGDIAELPPLFSILTQMVPRGSHGDMSDLRVFLGGVCAAVTITAAGAITVMLALDARGRVAHAAAGDQRCTLAPWKLPFLLSSTASFQGKLYAAYSSGKKDIISIHQIDPPPQPNSESPPPQPTTIAELPLVGTHATSTTVHLVESESECGLDLFLLGFNDPFSCPHAHPAVYRVADLITGRIVPVKDIGDHALFLGEQRMCVSSNKGIPSDLANTIICRHRSKVHSPQTGTRRLCHGDQYHLGTGTWSPAIDEETPLASPYMLVHQIYTCYYRSYWNKGLMYSGAIRPDWSVKPDLFTGVIPS